MWGRMSGLPPFLIAVIFLERLSYREERHREKSPICWFISQITNSQGWVRLKKDLQCGFKNPRTWLIFHWFAKLVRELDQKGSSRVLDWWTYEMQVSQVDTYSNSSLHIQCIFVNCVVYRRVVTLSSMMNNFSILVLKLRYIHFFLVSILLSVVFLIYLSYYLFLFMTI